MVSTVHGWAARGIYMGDCGQSAELSEDFCEDRFFLAKINTGGSASIDLGKGTYEIHFQE
jgi:hypothetical protein